MNRSRRPDEHLASGQRPAASAAKEVSQHMPVQRFAQVFGAVYVLVGLLGFAFTGFASFAGTSDDKLLLFGVNPLHNIIHIVLDAFQSDFFHEILEENRPELDRSLSGSLRLSDRHQCRCEVRHIALRHLPYLDNQEALAGRALKIATKFRVSPEEQDDLFHAAALLVNEMEVHKLLATSSMVPRCEVGDRPPARK